MARQTAQPKVKREIQELSLLFDVSRRLADSMDLRDVVGPVLAALAEHMGMSRGTLALLKRENDLRVAGRGRIAAT